MYIETEVISMEDISLSDFCNEISSDAKFCIDVDSLIGVCGVSPVRVHYETDRIDVIKFFPEKILLKSGKNCISIGMVRRIRKVEDDLGVIFYEIQCGASEEFSMTVKMVRI